jgi:hypothetical protein
MLRGDLPLGLEQPALSSRTYSFTGFMLEHQSNDQTFHSDFRGFRSETCAIFRLRRSSINEFGRLKSLFLDYKIDL